MTQDEPFLQAIVASPEDDAPRLIYADWLEERGDPRGEFIRTQVALARMGMDDQRWGRFMGRQSALLDEHRAAWLGESWNEALGGVRFRRGFVHEVAIHPRLLHQAAEDFFRHFPLVRRVRFCETRGGGRELLDFSRESKEYYADLLRLPYLAGLEALSLRGNHVGDEAVIALAGSPHVAGLKSLDLHHNGIGDTGVEALLASPYLTGLVELDFAENGFSWAALEALQRRFGEALRLTPPWQLVVVGSTAGWSRGLLVAAILRDESRARTRDEVIDGLLAGLVDEWHLPWEAADEISEGILRREWLGSTGIGYGLAVPHTKHESVGDGLAVLAVTRKGVDWNSIDGEPVEVILLVVSPRDRPDYTPRGLTELVQHLRREPFRRRLRKATTREQLRAVLETPDQEAG
jgi:uncharacterized protein (TIGR02996 family)